MKEFVPKLSRVFVTALIFAVALPSNRAEAAYVWDPQGANPQNPYLGSLTGSWETTNWTIDANLSGTANTTNWVEGNTALFAVNVGSGTPAFTVTMNSNHTV